MKISDEQYDQLSEKIYQYQQVRFDAPYWFDDDPDQYDYCLDCAIKKEVDNSEWKRDGGFHSESDSPMRCEACGKWLEHTLSDYGALQELEHYEENVIDLESDFVQYTLCNISGGVPLSYPDRLYALIFGEVMR